MVNVSQNGFFDMDIDPFSTVPRIITLFIHCSALVIQCVIALSFWYKIRGSGTSKVSVPLLICAAVCFAFAFYYCLWSIVLYSWAPTNVDTIGWTITRSIYFTFLRLFFWSLLLILIIRLYITFKPSVYRMRKRMIVMFVVILSLILILWVLAVILIVLNQLNFGYYATFLGLFLYVIGCILAVYFFVSNLHKLAKSRVTSMQILSVCPNDIKLDQQQQKLSDLSSKYVMLFGIATSSTILVWILNFCVNFEMRANFLMMDLIVNLWCIYLQFSFANTEYRSCCKWCDGKIRNIANDHSRLLIHKHTISIQMSRSISSPTSTSITSPNGVVKSEETA